MDGYEETDSQRAWQKLKAAKAYTSEAAKQLRYAGFRFMMWLEHRGTYSDIDRDFADGKLDEQWREYLTEKSK